MRVIVITLVLFISVVVGDEGGVAMNPEEEAGISETTNPMFNGQPQTLGMNAFFRLKFSKNM